MLLPRTSGGSLILPMVRTMPRTAATIPRPGSESATVATLLLGADSSSWWLSSSASMRASSSLGSILVVMTVRRVSTTRSRAWWFLKNLGYFVKITLSLGLSTSPSTETRPSLRIL